MNGKVLNRSKLPGCETVLWKFLSEAVMKLIFLCFVLFALVLQGLNILLIEREFGLANEISSLRICCATSTRFRKLWLQPRLQQKLWVPNKPIRVQSEILPATRTLLKNERFIDYCLVLFSWNKKQLSRTINKISLKLL